MQVCSMRASFALLAALFCFSAQAGLHFYDPVQVSNRFLEQFHPAEKVRDRDYFSQLARVGRNLGCGAAVAAYANNELSKVFHHGIIGHGLVKFELLPNRPPSIRHGMFADGIDISYGVASFTTGRSTARPLHLKPDVTGLTVGLVINGKWVVLTTTASKGAFGKTAEEFSRLAGWSAVGAAAAGGLDSAQLRENLAALRRGEPPPYPNNGAFLRWLAMEMGGAVGEGLFLAWHPSGGLFTLAPAVLTGRRTPYTGYGNIGFGSGHAYLLTEDVPLEERTAFRYGFRLADTPYNRKLREEIPGFAYTLYRATLGGDFQYLRTEFEKWNFRGDIEYEMYVQLEDKSRPYRTSVENPTRRWRTEQIPVARLTLLQRREDAGPGPGPDVGASPIWGARDPFLYPNIYRALNNMPFNPAFGCHLPLGNLGFGRAAGPVLGQDMMAGQQTAGGYWESAILRNAVGMNSTGIDWEGLQWGIDLVSQFPQRYRRYEAAGDIYPEPDFPYGWR